MSVDIRVTVNNTETYEYEPRSFQDDPREMLRQLDAGYKLTRAWLIHRCGSACTEPEKQAMGFAA